MMDNKIGLLDKIKNNDYYIFLNNKWFGHSETICEMNELFQEHFYNSKKLSAVDRSFFLSNKFLFSEWLHLKVSSLDIGKQVIEPQIKIFGVNSREKKMDKKTVEKISKSVGEILNSNSRIDAHLILQIPLGQTPFDNNECPDQVGYDGGVLSVEIEKNELKVNIKTSFSCDLFLDKFEDKILLMFKDMQLIALTLASFFKINDNYFDSGHAYNTKRTLSIAFPVEIGTTKLVKFQISL